MSSLSNNTQVKIAIASCQMLLYHFTENDELVTFVQHHGVCWIAIEQEWLIGHEVVLRFTVAHIIANNHYSCCLQSNVMSHCFLQ